MFSLKQRDERDGRSENAKSAVQRTTRSRTRVQSMSLGPSLITVTSLYSASQFPKVPLEHRIAASPFAQVGQAWTVLVSI